MNSTYKKVETIDFESKLGSFKLSLFETTYPDQPKMNFVLVIHPAHIDKCPIIRIHSSCLYGDTFGSLYCDCREQLESSLEIINKSNGILFYLDQEGRGHGLFDKTREMKLQQLHGLDTVEASVHLDLDVDSRKYDVVVDLLRYMGIFEVNLMTNNPHKISSLVNGGIKVSQVPLEMSPGQFNRNYQLSKKNKLGHTLSKYV